MNKLTGKLIQPLNRLLEHETKKAIGQPVKANIDFRRPMNTWVQPADLPVPMQHGHAPAGNLQPIGNRQSTLDKLGNLGGNKLRKRNGPDSVALNTPQPVSALQSTRPVSPAAAIQPLAISHLLSDAEKDQLLKRVGAESDRQDADLFTKVYRMMTPKATLGRYGHDALDRVALSAIELLQGLRRKPAEDAVKL